MFFLDGILANRDRHRGNWGYVKTAQGYRVAPLYDNGACLFPDIMANVNEYDKDKKKFILQRAEQYPACLFRDIDENGQMRRTNYYRFINEINLKKYKHMNEIYEVFKSIDVKDVELAIDSAVDHNLLPEVLKLIYKQIVVARFMHNIYRVSLDEIGRLL